MFDDGIKFMYPWRPYQERVLRDASGFLKDGKINVVAAPRFWKDYFGVGAC